MESHGTRNSLRLKGKFLTKLVKLSVKLSFLHVALAFDPLFHTHAYLCMLMPAENSWQIPMISYYFIFYMQSEPTSDLS